MAYSLSFAEAALADLRAIHDDIGVAAPRNAACTIHHSLVCFNRIRDFPKTGPLVAGFPEVRQIVVAPRVIFYRIDDERTRVTILRV